MTKEDEILKFLSENVFNPILTSKKASKKLKSGVNLTIMRLKRLDASGMVRYFWSAISGTPRSIEFAKQMKKEGVTRFEEVIDKFRETFSRYLK